MGYTALDFAKKHLKSGIFFNAIQETMLITVGFIYSSCKLIN